MCEKVLEICKGREHVIFFLSVVTVISVPPSIADEPTDFLVSKRAPALVPCTASGVPLPSIHWMKNGIRLLPRGDGYRIQSSGKTRFSDYASVDWNSYEWMTLHAFLFFLHQERIGSGEKMQLEWEREIGKERKRKKKVWKQNNNV